MAAHHRALIRGSYRHFTRNNTAKAMCDIPAKSIHDIFSADGVIECNLIVFLCPLDAIALMHVCSSFRPQVAIGLRNMQSTPQTKAHNEVFQEWLKKPDITRRHGHENWLWDGMKSNDNLAGQLDIDRIAQSARALSFQFVLMNYKRSYTHETSCVAIFNEQGSFIMYYELSSEMFYEDIPSPASLAGETGARFVIEGNDGRPMWNMCLPKITIKSTASIFSMEENKNDIARWKINEQDIAFGHYGLEENETSPYNYTLYRQMETTLNVVESTLVLMHSLSGDPRVIFTYTRWVFDSLVSDFELLESGNSPQAGENVRRIATEWLQALRTSVIPNNVYNEVSR